MAELADAHGSGPCRRNPVWVQLPPSAPLQSKFLITLIDLIDLINDQFLQIPNYKFQITNKFQIQNSKFKTNLRMIILGIVLNFGH